jgi:hypothetical protein
MLLVMGILLVVLLFGFACGYGVREWISRRRRRRYRQCRNARLVQRSDEVATLDKLRARAREGPDAASKIEEK